jgi:hypothetical protein
MTRGEQQAGYAIAAVAAVFVSMTWGSDAFGGSGHAAAMLGLGLGASALFGLACWWGRRVWTAFGGMAAAFAEVPKGKGGLISWSLVCLAYSFWLMLQVSRGQSKAAAAARARARDGKDRGPTAQPASRRGKAARTGDGSGAPSANRRYTPPKAKPKRPSRYKVAGSDKAE